MSRSTKKKRGVLFGAILGIGATLSLVLSLGLLASAGTAASTVAPKNTAEPSILGTAVEDNTLTATSGTWSGSPTTLAYRWLRCPTNGGLPDGSNCGVIPSATTSAYQVRTADVGFRIRVRVIASNADGSASAASNATAIVIAAGKRPVSTSPPTISGTPAVGRTLTANQGTWAGSEPISYSGQWRRCDKIGGNCSNIGGPTTDKTYTLKSVDLGNTLRITVTAKNAAGTTSATSVPTAVITAGAPPPPATGCPTGSGTIQVATLAPPARLLLVSQQSDPGVVTPGTQELIVRYRVTACGGRPVQGAVVYATAVPFNQFNVPAEQTTNADGWSETEFRVRSFPVSSKQQLLAMFARARKSGEPLQGGISTRRLFSIPVNQ